MSGGSTTWESEEMHSLAAEAGIGDVTSLVLIVALAFHAGAGMDWA
jgi:hypothetical protein